MYKKYLKRSLSLFVFIMFIIACINFIVDPGEIYFKRILADRNSAEFSNKLFNSKHGVLQTGWNERLIKTILAKEAGKFDCIVVGSSHMMQISSVRNTGNINAQCNNLLNLCVSGGSIEDISVFSYIILNNIQLPRQVFIGIDPWTLKFGMDMQYAAYKNYYDEMNLLLEKKAGGENVSYLSKIIQNLFNGEYFYHSLRSLVKITDKKKSTHSIFSKEFMFPDENYSYTIGMKNHRVVLIDGSYVYDKDLLYLQKNNKIKVGLGGGDYRLSGEIYDKLALIYLQKLIDLYKYNGVKVNLVLTPYHPNVFKRGETKAVKYFKVVETIIRKLSINNNLKIYGSYFADNVGCKEGDFLDFQHPLNDCLNKIDFSK